MYNIPNSKRLLTTKGELLTKMATELKIMFIKLKENSTDLDIKFLVLGSKTCTTLITEKCRAMSDLEIFLNQEQTHGLKLELKKQKKLKRELPRKKKLHNLKRILLHLNKMSNWDHLLVGLKELNRLQEESLMPMVMVLRIIEVLLDHGLINSMSKFMEMILTIFITPTMEKYQDMNDMVKIQRQMASGSNLRKPKPNSLYKLVKSNFRILNFKQNLIKDVKTNTMKNMYKPIDKIFYSV